MGISSDWMKILKEECPEAFTAKCPLRPRAAFIDGQIQLQKSSAVTSWDQFVYCQFTCPIRRMFRDHGASVVILAFDSYALVPRAKAATQLKRARKVSAAPFHERAQLPETIPACWEAAIMNRAFKARVIQLVIARLPRLLDLAPGEQLIVDYIGHPVVYGPGSGALDAPPPAPMPELAPLGEADLKFFRYAELFGSLLAMATDSDYLPIALLRLHTQFRDGREPPRVALLRLRVSLPSDDEKTRKRGADGRAKREREFVDVNLVLAALLGAFRQLGPAGAGAHSHAPHFVSMFCALVALFGGTDFTRPMPQVGPRRVWDALVHVFPALVRSFDTERGLLLPDAAADELIGGVYARVYATHTGGCPAGLPRVLARLQASKLGAATRARLPSAAFVAASVRNANWVLLYWAGLAPDELLGGDFGFAESPTRPGVIAFADTVA